MPIVAGAVVSGSGLWRVPARLFEPPSGTVSVIERMATRTMKTLKARAMIAASLRGWRDCPDALKVITPSSQRMPWFRGERGEDAAEMATPKAARERGGHL